MSAEVEGEDSPSLVAASGPTGSSVNDDDVDEEPRLPAVALESDDEDEEEEEEVEAEDEVLEASPTIISAAFSSSALES